ncbi:MAG: adenosylcobalamin-dependent ribonucleoside-diphosphate reductase [Bacteroidales bacterium]|nr:adenosylcobalamin-dependent ribonucleoside-diphosphate reductase [Bacteroidales bacterium]
MTNELSLFGFMEENESESTVLDKQPAKSSGLLQSRESSLQKNIQPVNDIEEKSSPVRKIYTKSEILADVVSYFGGDELAAGVWIDKYALKDKDGQLLERTPEEMHHRLASEFARIEKRYANPMSEEMIFSLFDHFKYIVPQGSPMAGIGNNDQIVSLSNCFVIGNDSDSDSYGGIMKMDEEQVQLMKRRGGVGHDLSSIRPSGSHVQNCALTSTGVVPFMERYSNSTREVAQDGRRGALMLSISIKHPDSEKFIDAKMTEGKVTGANVSVKIDDDFMKSVKNEALYEQKYPIESETPRFQQNIDASKLWKKIIHNAWKSAEPGVLFWDTILRESVPDCYKDEGFKTVSTNPCGEIPLCPYDSCRLIAMNLYSYVDKPFTPEASFNMPLFRTHVQYAQRLMDDIIDLELEKIDRILAKIESDPENDNVKRVEKELWTKIRRQSLKGRRTGLGITAEGDMLAALNIRYGSEEGNAFSTEVHKQLALAAYRSSVNMAKERGAFPIYSCIKEGHNPFIHRIATADPKLYDDMVRYGRRNIALLTIAPTGSVSICTQTTSGLEPAFNVVYKRRRKINPNDINISKSIVKDTVGDMFEEYMVFHPKFVIWAETKGYTLEQMKQMNDKEIQALVEQSPYYKATAADTDYLMKVALQGSVQKWVDHSISVTVNLPADVSEQVVADLYMKAWECGCKGMTVYREGSRDGVLNSIKDEKKAEEQKTPKNFKRPKELHADVIHFKNNSEDWVAYIGIYDGKPYEIFTGKTGEESFQLPKWVEHGIIIKNRHEDGTKSYDFKYYDKAGYEVILCGLDRCFDQEFWNYAKLTSALLRNGMPVTNIVNIISSLNFRQESINSWRNGVCRALKKFIQDGTKQKGVICPKCNQKDTMEFKEGCLVCSNCGYSKCGS